MRIKRNHIAVEEPIRMAQSPDVYLVPCKNGPECGLPKPPEELLRGTKTVILWVDQPVEEQELRSALDTAGEDGAVVVNCPEAHLETVRAAIPPALRRWQRRRKIRARNDLSPEERAKRSAGAVERLAESDLFRNARTVMIYDHVRGELSLDSLLTHPASAGKRFCYPLCVSDTEMIAMVPGHGVPAPSAFGSRYGSCRWRSRRRRSTWWCAPAQPLTQPATGWEWAADTTTGICRGASVPMW